MWNKPPIERLRLGPGEPLSGPSLTLPFPGLHSLTATVQLSSRNSMTSWIWLKTEEYIFKWFFICEFHGYLCLIYRGKNLASISDYLLHDRAQSVFSHASFNLHSNSPLLSAFPFLRVRTLRFSSATVAKIRSVQWMSHAPPIHQGIARCRRPTMHWLLTSKCCACVKRCVVTWPKTQVRGRSCLHGPYLPGPLKTLQKAIKNPPYAMKLGEGEGMVD